MADKIVPHVLKTPGIRGREPSAVPFDTRLPKEFSGNSSPTFHECLRRTSGKLRRGKDCDPDHKGDSITPSERSPDGTELSVCVLTRVLDPTPFGMTSSVE